jgi:RIP metalloprotease RseP
VTQIADARSDEEGSWPRRQLAETGTPAPETSGAPETPEGSAAAPRRPGFGAGDDPRSAQLRLAMLAFALVAGLMFFGPYLFYIVGALLVSIFLHEFGHYWVARRSGMKVTEYFLGFGPRIWSFNRNGVEYGLKAIPAGAYVKIVGMNEFEEVDPAEEPRTYRAQGTFKRLLTVLAGPFMNLLIAFVLMTTLFLVYGREADTWAVNKVTPGSAADAAGLRAGDRLLAVDGSPVGQWDSFRGQLAEKAGRPVTFTIERDGSQVESTATLGWRLDADTAAAFPSQPALSPGDVLASLDGAPLATYEDLVTQLHRAGPPVTLRVIRADEPYDLQVERPLALPAAGAAGFLGVEPTHETVRETPVGALSETAQMMGTGVTGTFSAFGRLLTPSGIGNMAGQVAEATQATTTLAPHAVGRLTPVDGSPEPAAPSNLSADRPLGIVGIVGLGTQAAQLGLPTFLLIVAGLNLALGLFNLVPMLPLDGGHASIAIYEGIRGRLRGAPYRADVTKLMPFVYGFIGLLVMLAVSSTLLDVLRPPSLR